VVWRFLVCVLFRRMLNVTMNVTKTIMTTITLAQTRTLYFGRSRTNSLQQSNNREDKGPLEMYFQLFSLFVLIVSTLKKVVLLKFLHLMSDGAKLKIDCRRRYMAFYILSDNTRITLSD